MIIIHGENTIQSRQKLVDVINQAKDKNILIERLSAKSLTLPGFESKLQKTDLFGHSRLLIVEGLHSLPRSKKKNSMIQLLANSDMSICLWEKRKLTPTMVKKFKNATVHHYKIANSLFNWLDSFSPNSATIAKQLKLFKLANTDNDQYLCFIMLARQIRMLIQAKSGGKIGGPYFVVQKIKRQAANFSQQQLLKTHQALFQIDQQIKSSTNYLSIQHSIEQVLLNLVSER